MLDLKFVREHQDEVEQALKNRGQEISLEEYRGREAERRQLLTRLEELRHERNTLSKEVGALMQAGKRDEAQPLRDRVTAINEESKNLEAQTEAQDSWVRDFLLNLPNLPHESVPVGASSDDNPVVHTWKGRAKHLISGTAVSIKAHERVNEPDNREARTSSVADWGAAAISVPTEDLAGRDAGSAPHPCPL